MDDVANNVRIFSNWACLGEENLNKTITYSSGNKEYSLENVVAENCVCLHSPEHENATKPILEIKSEYNLKQIDVLSEGNFVEVFGNHNEYLFSCEAELIDYWDEMAVYHVKIPLPGILKCELKFTKIKDEKRLWIYNIQLIVTKLEKTNDVFNFKNVNQLLKDSGQQISKNAQSFKSFFEMYANSKSKNQNFICQPPEMQILRQIFCQNQFKELEEKKEFFLKALNDPNLEFKDVSKNSNNNTAESNGQTKSDDLLEFIKNYIDWQLCRIKDDITESIGKKLNEIQKENQAKLDLVIQMLESLNSKLQNSEDERKCQTCYKSYK